MTPTLTQRELAEMRAYVDRELKTAPMYRGGLHVGDANRLLDTVERMNTALRGLMEAAEHFAHCRDCGESGIDNCHEGQKYYYETLATSRAALAEFEEGV